MSTQPTQGGVPQWNLADRFRKIRTDRDLHQRDFATMLGVTPAAYAAWESGRNHPHNVVAVAKRIEMLTGVPATWVLGLNEQGPRPGVSQDGGAPGGTLRPRLDSNQQPTDWRGAA